MGHTVNCHFLSGYYKPGTAQTEDRYSSHLLRGSQSGVWSEQSLGFSVMRTLAGELQEEVSPQSGVGGIEGLEDDLEMHFSTCPLSLSSSWRVLPHFLGFSRHLVSATGNPYSAWQAGGVRPRVQLEPE